MIGDAVNKNYLPTAAGFVDKHPRSKSLMYKPHTRKSTIHDREPLPMYRDFEYKKPMDFKQTHLWKK